MSRDHRFYHAYHYLMDHGLIDSQRDLAEKMDAAEASISKAMHGDNAVLTDRFLKRFNNAFFNLFDEAWLLGGKGYSDVVLATPEPKMPSSEERGHRIWEAIQYLMYDKKIDLDDLAKGMKVRENTLKYICFGGRDHYFYSNNFLLRFNSAAGKIFNEKWLLEGDGGMLNPEAPEHKMPRTPTSIIKYYPNVMRTTDKLPFSDKTNEQYIKLSLPVKECSFAILMPDSSMEPTIKSGHIILLAKQRKESLEWGKIYLVDTGDFWYVRRLFPSISEENKNKANGISENPHYPPVEFNLENANMRLYLVRGWICRDV